MVAYKEWGYQLYPGIAFEDLASRTEKLGGKARTRDLMHELRDTERDRVVEARYGRAAVENVRAQEAAKLVAKESKAAAAQEEVAEELEDKELAGSRYMEEIIGDVGGNGDVQTAPGLSEQVRQRMEVNRRLALERLRLKKEEAAAAALEEGDNAESAAGPLDADGGGGEGLVDLMDVDDGDGAGEAEDEFEDDEAALADMQTEEVMAPTVTKLPARVGNTQQVDTVAAAVPGVSPAAAATAAVTNSVDSAPAGADPQDVTLAESTNGRSAANDEVESRASGAATTAVADDLAPAPVSAISDGMAVGAVDSSATSAAVDATSGGGTAGVDGSQPSRAPESSEPTAGLKSGEENGPGRHDRRDTSRLAPGADVATATADVAAAAVGRDSELDGAKVGEGGDDGAEAPSAKGGDEQVSFSSPVKCRSASGLPLSPLGNLFASTDVSAEGGSAAVRAPLGGLFSDENL
ncbi:unnamed protein product [Pylaiella littoralis]